MILAQVPDVCASSQALAEAAADSGEVRPLLEPLLRAGASRVGATGGVAAGEEFRVVTFGGMQALLDRFGTRRS